jgi:O-succinylbenzoic acid--CoA ligase
MVLFNTLKLIHHDCYNNLSKCSQSFKLNYFHLNRNDLCRVAYSFIKEGENLKNLEIFYLDWFDNKSYIEMNTSGTTGTPKLIRVDTNDGKFSAAGDFELEPGDKALHCLPTKYIAEK